MHKIKDTYENKNKNKINLKINQKTCIKNITLT